MVTLRLVSLDDTVIFPGMPVTLPVDVGTDERVLLIAHYVDHKGGGNTYAKVGVVAEVAERLQNKRGRAVTSLIGLHRGIPGVARADADGVLRVEVEERPDVTPPPIATRELDREYRAVVEEILEIRGDDGRISAFVRSITEPGALADTAGYSPDLNVEQKLELLETVDVIERLRLALRLQQERLAELRVRKRIREDVESGAQKQQREYFLRRQMDAIRKELGENDGSVVEDYRKKIAEAGMPDPVQQQAARELSRLERMGDSNAEASMIRTYLDWLLAVPWSKRSEERLDPRHAREVLDKDHAGLEKVKERITEYLAVRKLRAERGLSDDRRSGAILTLIGPPGTGKTSIGESIARATGRQFVRMSLGGVRDEAEIRGHRRTYIGALPGRLVRALRDAGTMNPVILLDEVDKLGADWRGDPSAALLEVLDPAQNHSFQDHYLDVALDLSHVLFIATANVAETIPGPLLDRMEVIPFDGYTTDEKVAIAQGYLWPRQVERNGLAADDVTTDDETLRLVVSDYTREAGVRQLERELGKVLRKTAARIAARGGTPPAAKEGAPEAKREGAPDAVPEGAPGAAREGAADASPEQSGAVPSGAVQSGAMQGAAVQAKPIVIDRAAVRETLGRPKFELEAAARTEVPGVATGLAVTSVGGDVLFVEAASMVGQGDGGLVLTGQLGDVMKESARIALTYVRSHASRLGIDEGAFDGREFHVHVPAGAIPKDGPSAGVTMVTALTSLLTGRLVKGTVGMTGEVTLQGRVLPIGGLKQKVLAAHAAGLTDVILPERNAPDLDDVPASVRERMRFHPVASVDQVLAIALEPQALSMAA
jgi:ATP-dependent Lon protease